MVYNTEALTEMAGKVSLLEYAGRTCEFVKRSGSNHYAICPFHNEKTPSLCINTSTNKFHCFGCGKSGNIYDWIRATEGLSFKDAVEKVAGMTGIDPSDYMECESMSVFKEMERMSTPKKQEATQRRFLDYEKDYDQKFAHEYPQIWLDEGISKESLDKYEIRIDKGSRRIVYPIYDSEDRLIGVKGRITFENYKALRLSKYINYYPIGSHDFFCGMKQARESVKAQKEIIILEGIKSVMKLDGWGIHNAVSAETSALSEQQVELLIKMGIRKTVIAFDQDVAMDKIKAFSKILARYTNLYVVIDKWRFLRPKDSPVDEGLETWKALYERKVKI